MEESKMMHMPIKHRLGQYPRILRFVLLSLFVAACVANFVLFPKWVGTSYLKFYANAGAVVSVGTLFLELAWKEMDKNQGITSRDPLVYLGSTLQLIGLPLVVMGVHLDRTANANRASALELLLCIPFVLLMLCGLVIWTLAIAPAHYFVNTLCQAPAKLIQGSSARVYARLKDGWQLEYRMQQADDPVPEEQPATPATPPTPPTRGDSTMHGHATKLTSAYAAVLLLALAWLLA
jgi:hypothetical protein